MSNSTFTSQSAAPRSTSQAIQGCHEFAALFQHPLLEEPLASTASRKDHQLHAMLIHKASNICASCPLLQQCLYNAVVKHDVSGIVAGATPRQRMLMRNRLGITVRAEDFDQLAGVTGGNRHVDHDEVVRLRHAYPHESLEALARRLGCSLSTVKRHLRRHRNEANLPRVQPPSLPTLAEVMAVYHAVISPAPATTRAA